jgi:hypothetical protein
MCVDCVLASPRITQVDPGDEPLSEVVLSQITFFDIALKKWHMHVITIYKYG